MRKISIIFNPKIRGIETVKRDFENIITRHGGQVIPCGKETELLMSLGGDGTVLKGFRNLPSFDIPILGLNFGKFGFLTMNCKNKVKTVKDVIAEQFFISPRIYLTAFLIAKNKKQFMGNALNEMVIFREDIRMVRFEIKFGSATFQLRADGMIISTPTGSTAHAFSAGGPIVFPEEKTMIIVALAPFATTWRNCIYEGSRLLIKSSGNCNIVMDGQEKFTLQKNKPLEIKIGDGVFKLLVSKDWNFWKTLKEKFLWGKTLS